MINKWLSLWSIGEAHSLEDLKLIKQAGFVGVEIWGDHKESEKSLLYAQKCNFEIGMHLPFRDLNLASTDESIGNKTVEVMKEYLDKLAYYGGIHAVIHGGWVIKDEDWITSSELLKKRLKHLNDYANQYGIILLYENQIPASSSTKHIFPSDLIEWLDTLESTHTKACLDLGHLYVQGDSFYKTVDKLGDFLEAVHISDNDGKADLHMLPGDGDMFKKYSLDYLSEINFKGPLVYEINSMNYSLNEILENLSINTSK